MSMKMPIYVPGRTTKNKDNLRFMIAGLRFELRHIHPLTTFASHKPLPFRRCAYFWPFTVHKSNEKRMAEALSRGGFVLDPSGLEDHDPLAHTAAEYETLLDTSLSLTEVSRMLDIDVVDVLWFLEDRTLYGVRIEGEWKFLGFQFEEGRPLPGLGKVLPLLSEDLHPMAIYRWFVSPSINLIAKGEPSSPRQWLLSGRSITTVARIAIDV